MNNEIDPNKGKDDSDSNSSPAVIHPITGGSHSGDTSSVGSSGNGAQADYIAFGNNTDNTDGYQSILGGKFCCFRMNKKLRERLVFGLATLSAVFILGVVCGLIYYADRVNSDYFPPGLAYAVYTAIGFSGIVGPLLSFFLSTVLSFDKRSITELSPILSNIPDIENGHSAYRGTNIRLCCCGRVMIEFYPIKNLRTLFGIYLLGTVIPGLIIVLQIANN